MKLSNQKIYNLLGCKNFGGCAKYLWGGGGCANHFWGDAHTPPPENPKLSYYWYYLHWHRPMLFNPLNPGGFGACSQRKFLNLRLFKTTVVLKGVFKVYKTHSLQNNYSFFQNKRGGWTDLALPLAPLLAPPVQLTY